MFKNIYILQIENKKILYKLIKYGLNFIKIEYYQDHILIYVDYDNYLKLLKYQKLFNIILIKQEGFNKYKLLLKKYYLFIIGNIIGLIIIWLLSNIIFKVKIMTTDREIFNLLNNELAYYGVKKYNFIKSYSEITKIKEAILVDNKDKLEWLEITRNGSSYIINVERRVINNLEENKEKHNVIAKKNAIIKEIRASHGSIIKKVNDYVNKGDIIVTGVITKGDKVMNYVDAKAIIYGETWYNVKVLLPVNYYDKIYTNRQKRVLSLNFLDKKIKIFDFKPYQKAEITEHILLQNNLLPLSLNLDKVYEIEDHSDILTNDKIESIAQNIAYQKLLNTLAKDSKILSQKKLKLNIKNSTIEIDIFFKVYENITDYQNIIIE